MRICNVKHQKLLLVITLLGLIMMASAGCQPREVTVVQTVEVTRLSEITVEVTRLVTVIVTQTFTPGPSATPTISLTPSRTASSTPTRTPVNVYNCRRITLNLNGDIHAQLSTYDGQCIAVFYNPTNQRSYGLDYSTPLRITYSLDLDNYPDTQNPNQYSVIYGVLNYPSNASGDPRMMIIRVDPLPTNQRPVGGDLLYNVGANQRMAPGVWKSDLLPTANDSCYWSRLDPNTGDIRDNHFGLPGVSVRLYEGDVFESTEDCGTWYYVGP